MNRFVRCHTIIFSLVELVGPSVVGFGDPEVLPGAGARLHAEVR